MRQLETIQTKEKLNNVFVVDEVGPGGANHAYEVRTSDNLGVLNTIQFQKGPRKDENSVPGVIDTDLLEIVRDRLISFQAGPFASDYNAKALVHVEEALKALNQRVEDRIDRNVLGTNNK